MILFLMIAFSLLFSLSPQSLLKNYLSGLETIERGEILREERGLAFYPTVAYLASAYECSFYKQSHFFTSDSVQLQRRAKEWGSQVLRDYFLKGIPFELPIQHLKFESLFERQSSDPSLVSLMEVISNAMDAMNQEVQIGHFGKGVKQLLTHIKGEGDCIKITSKKEGEEAHILSVFYKEGGIYLFLRKASEKRTQGTRVEVFKMSSALNIHQLREEVEKRYSTYPGKVRWNGTLLEKMQNLLEVKNAESSSVQVVCQEHYFLCQDSGKGMSVSELLYMFTSVGSEKSKSFNKESPVGLFSNVPKESLEEEFYFDEIGVSRYGEVIVISKEKQRKGTEKNRLVIELGGSVQTDESRRRVIINSQLIQKVLVLIDQVLESHFSSVIQLRLIDSIYRGIFYLIDQNNFQEKSYLEELQLILKKKTEDLCICIQQQGIPILDTSLLNKRSLLKSLIKDLKVCYIHPDIQSSKMTKRSIEILGAEKVGCHIDNEGLRYDIYSFPSSYEKGIGEKESNGGIILRGKDMILCPHYLLPRLGDEIDQVLWRWALSETIETSYEMGKIKEEKSSLDDKKEVQMNFEEEEEKREDQLDLRGGVALGERITEIEGDYCIVQTPYGEEVRLKHFLDIPNVAYQKVELSVDGKYMKIEREDGLQSWCQVGIDQARLLELKWFSKVIIGNKGHCVIMMDQEGRWSGCPIEMDHSLFSELEWFDRFYKSKEGQWFIAKKGEQYTWFSVNMDHSLLSELEWFQDVIFVSTEEGEILSVKLKKNNLYSWCSVSINQKHLSELKWFKKVLNNEHNCMIENQEGQWSGCPVHMNHSLVSELEWFDDIYESEDGQWFIVKKEEKYTWFLVKIDHSLVSELEWFQDVDITKDGKYVRIKNNNLFSWCPVGIDHNLISHLRWFDDIRSSKNEKMIYIKQGDQWSWCSREMDQDHLSELKWFSKVLIGGEGNCALMMSQERRWSGCSVHMDQSFVSELEWFDDIYESENGQWFIAKEEGKYTCFPVHMDQSFVSELEWFDDIYESEDGQWFFVAKEGKYSWFSIETDLTHISKLEWFSEVKISKDGRRVRLKRDSSYVICDSGIDHALIEHLKWGGYISIIDLEVDNQEIQEKRQTELEGKVFLSVDKFPDNIKKLFFLSLRDEEKLSCLKYAWYSVEKIRGQINEDMDWKEVIEFIVLCENAGEVKDENRVGLYRYCLLFNQSEIFEGCSLRDSIELMNFPWEQPLKLENIQVLLSLLRGLGKESFSFVMRGLFSYHFSCQPWLSRLTQLDPFVLYLFIKESQFYLSFLSEEDKRRYRIEPHSQHTFCAYMRYLVAEEDICTFIEGDFLDKKRKGVDSLVRPLSLSQLQIMYTWSVFHGQSLCLEDIKNPIRVRPFPNNQIDQSIKKVIETQGLGVHAREGVANAMDAPQKGRALRGEFRLGECEGLLISMYRDNSRGLKNIIPILCQETSSKSLSDNQIGQFGNGSLSYLQGCREFWAESVCEGHRECVHLQLNEEGYLEIVGHRADQVEGMEAGFSMIRVCQGRENIPVALQAFIESANICRMVEGVSSQNCLLELVKSDHILKVNKDEDILVDLSLYERERSQIGVKILKGDQSQGESTIIQDKNGFYVSSVMSGETEYEVYFGLVPKRWRKALKQRKLIFQIDADLLRSRAGFFLTEENKKILQSKIVLALGIYFVSEYWNTSGLESIPQFPEDFLISEKYNHCLEWHTFTIPFENEDCIYIASLLTEVKKQSQLKTLLRLPFLDKKLYWTNLIDLKKKIYQFKNKKEQLDSEEDPILKTLKDKCIYQDKVLKVRGDNEFDIKGLSKEDDLTLSYIQILLSRLSLPVPLKLVKKGNYGGYPQGVFIEESLLKKVDSIKFWRILCHEVTHYYEGYFYQKNTEGCQGLETHHRDGPFSRMHQWVAQEILIQRKNIGKESQGSDCLDEKEESMEVKEGERVLGKRCRLEEELSFYLEESEKNQENTEVLEKKKPCLENYSEVSSLLRSEGERENVVGENFDVEESKGSQGGDCLDEKEESMEAKEGKRILRKRNLEEVTIDILAKYLKLEGSELGVFA